jgi:hypothetical protein
VEETAGSRENYRPAASQAALIIVIVKIENAQETNNNLQLHKLWSSYLKINLQLAKF